MEKLEEKFIDCIKALYNDRCPNNDVTFAKLGTYENNLYDEFKESNEFGSLLVDDSVDLSEEHQNDDAVYGEPDGRTSAQVNWYGMINNHSNAGQFEFRFGYPESVGGYQCLSISGGYGRGGGATRYIMLNRYLQTGYEGHLRKSIDMNKKRWRFVLPKITRLAQQLGVDTGIMLP